MQVALAPTSMPSTPLGNFFPSKIVPTNLPTIINKGKVEITKLGIRVIINHEEVANSQMLRTTPGKTNHLQSPNNQTHLDAMIRYAQIIHANYAMSMDTIHMNSLS